MWTVEINDLLFANIDALKNIFVNSVSPTITRSKKPSLQDTLKLFSETLNVSQQMVKYCFGMSKMTVINEDFGAKEYATI